MAKGDYEFPILVTCLLILLLQIHNPFQPAPQTLCQCGGEGGTVSGRAVDARAAAGRAAAQRDAEPAPQYRRPQAAPAAGGGLSTEELLRELDSIQVKAKDQSDTLAAAGRMPPASPVLQQIKDLEAENPPMVQPRAQPGFGQQGAAPPAVSPQGVPPGVPPAVPAGGAAAGAAQMPLMLRRRDDFGRFLQQRQPGGLGVVLGVGRGDFALRLLADWSMSQGLFLVDPYIHIWRGYEDPANVADSEHQLIFEDLRNRLVQFEGRYVLVRDFSHAFAETYSRPGQTPGPPSFVYVDANPAEDAVSRDLELWWQLLAPGGILAGGTYVDEGNRVRVRSVVDRFAARQGLQVYLTHDDVPPSWFLFKP